MCVAFGDLVAGSAANRRPKYQQSQERIAPEWPFYFPLRG